MMTNRRHSEVSLDATSGTAARTGTVSDYFSPKSVTNSYQVVNGIRDKIKLLDADVQDLHRESLEQYLREHAALKARNSVRSLLMELANSRGMAWVDIARQAGVSVAAVRKWRNGGDTSVENRQSLARLAAFLDLLANYPIDDPVQWLELPLPLPPGYTVRPMDLYLAGHAAAVLDFAAQRRNATQVMDDVQPEWRSRASSFEVFDDKDGNKSIRPRQA